MPSSKNLPESLSLPAIHAHWTAALLLPPTARLSNLRRLVRAVTKDHHPALRPLPLADLCPLYLDLALAYAFLGEYYLASKVFKEAVDNDSASAVGWFGLGLAQAELAEWRNARRSWKQCLQCFKSVGGQQEGIRYVLFQAQDEAARDEAAPMMEVILDSREWTLERTRVDFNLQVALREKGSKKLGVAPRSAGQKRPGLNGLPAGLRFGPGWDASLQSLDSPVLLQQSVLRAEGHGNGGAVSSSTFLPTAKTPPSSRTPGPRTSLPPHISSHKPLPALPHSLPTQIPSLADEGSFNDHKPPLDQDPFTSSPEKDIVEPFSTSSQTLITHPYNEHHERLSQQPTLFTPEGQYFYDHSDEDNDEYHEPSSAIDDIIASWGGLGQTREDQTREDQPEEYQIEDYQIEEYQAEEDQAEEDQTWGEEEEEGEEEKEEEEEEEWEEEWEEEETITMETHEKTSQDHSDFDSGEILQPRVFEGFGPPRHER
ncbi:MAG: hypothetical protein Q9161_002802 [Pseudevernia consocians]